MLSVLFKCSRLVPLLETPIGFMQNSVRLYSTLFYFLSELINFKRILRLEFVKF